MLEVTKPLFDIIQNIFRKISIFGLITLLLATFVRFYNFGNRIDFNAEQALALLVSGDYIKNKPSLLGMIDLQRVTSQGHILFSSAMFNYTLVPVMIFARFDPVLITAFFTLVNLMTGLLLYLIVRKLFNETAALFSMILFLFNGLMIHHSLFIGPSDYIPITNLLVFYLIYKFYKSRDNKILLFSAILMGFNTGLEYFYIFTLLLLTIFLLVISRNKILSFSILILGIILGNFSQVLFELKHNFYTVNTLWVYLMDTIKNPTQGGLVYYYFLQFWPVWTALGGLLLTFLYKRIPPLAILILLIYLVSNLTSDRVSFSQAIGMSPGMNIYKLEKAANIIGQDHPMNFNVAMLLDFDSRAYPLRYLLEYKQQIKPMGVEEYISPKSVYVLAEANYDFNKALAWEVTASNPKKRILLGMIDNRYWVYKLSK